MLTASDKTSKTARSTSLPETNVVVDEDGPIGKSGKLLGQEGGPYARRRSIFGESYNPETDTEVSKVYPKTDAQRRRLEESVSGILLFRSLDSEQKQRVIDAMFERKVSAGDDIIHQGEDGDNFYVVESGTFHVFVTSKPNPVPQLVYQHINRGCFGEMALMYNTPRSATVTAITDGVIWAMDRDSFRRIVLKSAFQKRQLYERFIAGVPILEALDDYERQNLADALSSRSYADGERIIREGDAADGMYFVEEGRVRVTIRKDGREKECSRMTKGKYFGEMALLERKPRSASIYAVGKVKVAFLERDSFERLLGSCTDIMKRKMKAYKKSS